MQNCGECRSDIIHIPAAAAAVWGEDECGKSYSFENCAKYGHVHLGSQATISKAGAAECAPAWFNPNQMDLRECWVCSVEKFLDATIC